MSALLNDGTAALQAVADAVPPATQLVAGTNLFATVQAAAAAAVTTISANLATAGAGINTSSPVPIGGVDAQSGVVALERALTETQDIAGLTALNGYAQRIVLNLNNASD